MDLVQSFLWISSLARIWTWKAPRSPKRAGCSLHFKQRNNKNLYLYILILYNIILLYTYIYIYYIQYICFICQCDEDDRSPWMMGSMMAHQQSRQFKTCQGRKLRNQNRSSNIHSHNFPYTPPVTVLSPLNLDDMSKHVPPSVASHRDSAAPSDAAARFATAPQKTWPRWLGEIYLGRSMSSLVQNGIFSF